VYEITNVHARYRVKVALMFTHLVIPRSFYFRSMHLVVPRAFYFRSMREIALEIGLGFGSVLGSFFYNSNMDPSGSLLVTFIT